LKISRQDQQMRITNTGFMHEEPWRSTPGYLLPNRHLFANERSAVHKGVALTVSGRMSEYDRDGRLVWSHKDPWQHHDARRLETGAIYAAFTELADAEKSSIKGGVPGSEANGGPFGEVIRQVDEDGRVF